MKASTSLKQIRKIIIKKDIIQIHFSLLQLKCLIFFSQILLGLLRISRSRGVNSEFFKINSETKLMQNIEGCVWGEESHHIHIMKTFCNNHNQKTILIYFWGTGKLLNQRNTLHVNVKWFSQLLCIFTNTRQTHKLKSKTLFNFI